MKSPYPQRNVSESRLPFRSSMALKGKPHWQKALAHIQTHIPIIRWGCESRYTCFRLFRPDVNGSRGTDGGRGIRGFLVQLTLNGIVGFSREVSEIALHTTRSSGECYRSSGLHNWWHSRMEAGWLVRWFHHHATATLWDHAGWYRAQAENKRVEITQITRQFVKLCRTKYFGTVGFRLLKVPLNLWLGKQVRWIRFSGITR